MKYLLELDDDLHKKLKIKAAKEETTIREIIIKSLKNSV